MKEQPKHYKYSELVLHVVFGSGCKRSRKRQGHSNEYQHVIYILDLRMDFSKFGLKDRNRRK